MSDTPRTDVESWRENRTEVVTADFARQLERELAELRAIWCVQIVEVRGDTIEECAAWFRKYMPASLSRDELLAEMIRALKDKP
jgi:hypothetical protein